MLRTKTKKVCVNLQKLSGRPLSAPVRLAICVFRALLIVLVIMGALALFYWTKQIAQMQSNLALIGKESLTFEHKQKLAKKRLLSPVSYHYKHMINNWINYRLMESQLVLLLANIGPGVWLNSLKLENFTAELELSSKSSQALHKTLLKLHGGRTINSFRVDNYRYKDFVYQAKVVIYYKKIDKNTDKNRITNKIKNHTKQASKM